MSIYTPRGLKIRLPMAYAFALVARLYPRVDAWRVLKTTEGLEHIPSVLSLIAGISCVALACPPLQLGLTAFLGSSVGSFLTRRGLYVIPGLPGLGTAYSCANGLGLIMALQVAGGILVAGWRHVVAFYLCTWAASWCNWFFEVRQMKKVHHESGMVLTGSEINFFNAYRLHACALGVRTDLELTDDELSRENWWQAYEQLAKRHPEVVARFTEHVGPTPPRFGSKDHSPIDDTDMAPEP